LESVIFATWPGRFDISQFRSSQTRSALIDIHRLRVFPVMEAPAPATVWCIDSRRFHNYENVPREFLRQLLPTAFIIAGFVCEQPASGNLVVYSQRDAERHDAERNAVSRAGDKRRVSGRFKVFFAATLLATLIAAATAQRMVSADALLPVTVTGLFCLAIVVTGIAALSRRDSSARMTGIDLAGVLTAVGIAASVLIEPDQVVRLISLPAVPE
jgi:hypothetical protein